MDRIPPMPCPGTFLLLLPGAAVARPGVPDCRSHWVGRHPSAPQIPAPGWAEPGPDVPADLPVFTRGVVSCPLLRASTGVSPSEQHILPRPPSLPRSCWEQVGFGSPWGRHPSSGSSFEPLTELRIPPYAFEATEEVGALWCQGCQAAPVSVSPAHPGKSNGWGQQTLLEASSSHRSWGWLHPSWAHAGCGRVLSPRAANSVTSRPAALVPDLLFHI